MTEKEYRREKRDKFIFVCVLVACGGVWAWMLLTTLFKI